jgi:hypothetical protein
MRETLCPITTTKAFVNRDAVLMDIIPAQTCQFNHPQPV